jgi:aerobic-type carbon monoxide dehydrogenase small subunit (CoxS/CutS family)
MGIKSVTKDKCVKRKINIRINGAEEEIYVEPWWTLSKVLREELNLTGTKVGCETGNCGTCTVLIDGKTVKSCLYPVMKVKGKEIITIEGLKSINGELHPLQKSFIEHFAVECGFCTPGMILSAKALLDENPAPSEEEVRESLSGNLCRCTGHVKIVEAVLAAGQKMRETSTK